MGSQKTTGQCLLYSAVSAREWPSLGTTDLSPTSPLSKKYRMREGACFQRKSSTSRVAVTSTVNGRDPFGLRSCAKTRGRWLYCLKDKPSRTAGRVTVRHDV